MSSRFFVGNVGPDATERGLLAFFVGRGLHVKHVSLVLDYATGHSRGFAFVEFEGAGEADAAIASLKGARIGDRVIELRHVDERAPADVRVGRAR